MSVYDEYEMTIGIAMMAASVIVIVPSVVFFMLIQRHIAGGLSEGSVK